MIDGLSFAVQSMLVLLHAYRILLLTNWCWVMWGKNEIACHKARVLAVSLAQVSTEFGHTRDNAPTMGGFFSPKPVMSTQNVLTDAFSQYVPDRYMHACTHGQGIPHFRTASYWQLYPLLRALWSWFGKLIILRAIDSNYLHCPLLDAI